MTVQLNSENEDVVRFGRGSEEEEDRWISLLTLAFAMDLSAYEECLCLTTRCW